ncbi:hypothetical protein BJ973_003604 [Actinoplanes tereljensis]|uniref:Uncharacterized protein n=1 Tax=Paractinoplanes tereljensis TaxID=571912 RepID=A0A919TYI5_9ACTN|nr:hypothetical protein [Actinoplanes tereljensis]GIF25325.1 hypothetical protein Ate02nite_80550 [Actinoplanes tereljensis]
MRHLAARVLTALALVAAPLAWASPASADVQGFAVNIGENPATFTIGKQARTLTAVATTERQQRRCIKVRWALTVRTDGVSLDQIRVNRVEDGQTFRVRTQVDDDAASIVDAQLDPGELCRDQTVTGRWDIAFTGPDDGEVTLEARALDVTGRQLSSTSTTSRVVTAVAAKPSASPSPSPSETATEEETEPVADTDTTPPGDPTSAAALNPASGTPSVLGPGLIIGAVLVFLGVALLLRIRTRNRKEDPAWQAQTQALPTGFYSMPRRRK